MEQSDECLALDAPAFLHLQVSHERVTNLEKIMSEGDKLKVRSMVPAFALYLCFCIEIYLAQLHSAQMARAVRFSK